MKKTPAPLITLHSGALGTPPNSLDYLKTAIRYKPDIIEIDVRVTGDNIAVLCHDPFITGISGEKVYLDSHPIRFLKDVKPDLLTLKEALRFSREKGLFLNLDLKSIEAADALVADLTHLDQSDNIIVSGCHKKEAAYLREKIPHLRVLYNIQDEELTMDPQGYMESVKTVVNEASRLGCCGLNVNYLFCRRDLVKYAALRSLPTMVWTIDDRDLMQDFMDMGVYSITTNRIDLLSSGSLKE